MQALPVPRLTSPIQPFVRSVTQTDLLQSTRRLNDLHNGADSSYSSTNRSGAAVYDWLSLHCSAALVGELVSASGISSPDFDLDRPRHESNRKNWALPRRELINQPSWADMHAFWSGENRPKLGEQVGGALLELTTINNESAEAKQIALRASAAIDEWRSAVLFLSRRSQEAANTSLSSDRQGWWGGEGHLIREVGKVAFELSDEVTKQLSTQLDRLVIGPNATRSVGGEGLA